MTRETDPNAIPFPALALGVAGLAPFFGLAVLALILEGPGAAAMLRALEIYGVAILSFMGGCRWGLAAAGLGEGPAWRPLALSTLPALYAWAAVGFGLPGPLLALAAGFAALGWADARLAHEGGAPAWWPQLRWPLTGGAVSALALGALA